MTPEQIKRLAQYHMTVAQIMTRLHQSLRLSDNDTTLYKAATFDMTNLMKELSTDAEWIVGPGEWPPNHGWWQEEIVEALR